MIEFPELHDALVDAARRRQARRVPRVLRVGVPALAAAAAVIAGLVLAIGAAGPDRERVVTPGPRGESVLERHFAAFRRPRKDADELPGRMHGDGHLRLGPGRSRLVARRGDVRAYLVPARQRGRPWLCTWLFLPGDTGGGGCAPVHRYLGPDAITTSTSAGVVQPGFLVAILPDGVEDVRVTLADGRVLRRAVRDNAVLVASPSPVATLAWTDASGRRREQSEPGDGCPELEPLPPDATRAAADAAAAAAPVLYPGARRATATGATPASESFWGRYAERECGEQAAARSIAVDLRLVPSDPAARQSASLTQGRVLAGVVNGRMRVWRVLH